MENILFIAYEDTNRMETLRSNSAYFPNEWDEFMIVFEGGLAGRLKVIDKYNIAI